MGNTTQFHKHGRSTRARKPSQDGYHLRRYRCRQRRRDSNWGGVKTIQVAGICLLVHRAAKVWYFSSRWLRIGSRAIHCMDLQAALCSYLLSVSSLHGSLQAIDWSHVSLPLDQPLNFFLEDEQSVSHIDRFAFTSRDSVNDIISCFLFHQ